jgi:hypothetical protein
MSFSLSVFTSPPEIVSWGPNQINLFAFAVGTDQALWYAQLDGFAVGGNTDAWSEWRSLGGVVVSPPRAVRSGESSVEVFAVGVHSELLHWQFHNGAWTSWPIIHLPTDGTLSTASHVAPKPHRNWESLGGILTSPPHAVMFGELNDMVLVFARGTDHALWTRAFANGSWRDWDTLGHRLSSPPHAVTWRRETFAVFALGTDSAIWSRWAATGTHLAARFRLPLMRSLLLITFTSLLRTRKER